MVRKLTGEIMGIVNPTSTQKRRVSGSGKAKPRQRSLSDNPFRECHKVMKILSIICRGVQSGIISREKNVRLAKTLH